jgi:hypothetical protein
MTTALSTLKRYWKGLAQTGAWLVGIVGVFVFPPPELVGSDSEKTFRLLCVFILSVLMGVLTLPLRKFKTKKAARGWSFASALALLIGVLLFFQYQSQRAQWSAACAKRRVVVGSVLTDAGKTYAANEAVFTKEAAVFDAGCKPALVWTDASIHSNAVRLHTLYTVVIVLFALAALMAIQAQYCATRPR